MPVKTFRVSLFGRLTAISLPFERFSAASGKRLGRFQGRLREDLYGRNLPFQQGRFARVLQHARYWGSFATSSRDLPLRILALNVDNHPGCSARCSSKHCLNAVSPYFGTKPNALAPFNSLRKKRLAPRGRIRTYSLSVNSREDQKSKCPIWCRL